MYFTHDINLSWKVLEKISNQTLQQPFYTPSKCGLVLESGCLSGFLSVSVGNFVSYCFAAFVFNSVDTFIMC